MATFRTAFAFNLKRIIDSKGLSQADLARGLDMTFQTVNGWINEKRGVSSETVSQVAAFLGVEETDLIQDPTVHEYKALADRLIQSSADAAFKAGLEQGRKTADPLAARIAKLTPEQRKMLENALRLIETEDEDEEAEERPQERKKR